MSTIPCSGKIIPVQGMSAKQISGLKTFETAGVPAKSQEAVPNSISGIYLFGPPMEHQKNASHSSIGEDSRFETNSTVNALQSRDNPSSGHEVLREGKSCGLSCCSSTSAFQNFSEAIDFHVQKSVRPFQVIHSFRECQRGPYLMGKRQSILLHNVPSRTTGTNSGRIQCILHRLGSHSRSSTFEWHLEQGGHMLSSHKQVGDVSKWRMHFTIIAPKYKGNYSVKMRQFNSRDISKITG